MKYSHDVIVIGAGSAGLVCSGGLAMFGLKPVLIERAAMGGDCLNTGCVPSKALISAAHRAHDMRNAAEFGMASVEPEVDFRAVHAAVHQAITTIEPHDSVERFEGMGVEVVRGDATFTGPKSVVVNGTTYTAPRIVIAVGSRAYVPPIKGLEQVPYLTNHNVWDLTELPRRLIVLGGGPIGMEMAQAFRRLGSEVVVASKGRPFPKDDSDAAKIVIDRLTGEGIELIVEAEADAVAKTADGLVLTLKDGRTITGTHLLIATGREVNFDGLGLEVAGVKYDKKGILVDARRRTSAKHIYAIGDCREGPRFTHVSGYEGGNVALEISLGVPTKANYAALPWVTYTDPELAQVGMTEDEARKVHGDTITVWREDFDHNDRAVTEREVTGFVKLVKKGSKVIGGTVVGRGAGDLILPIAMMIAGKSSTFGVASLIVPYPNRSEHIKAAAFASDEGKVFNKWSRGWARFLARRRG